MSERETRPPASLDDLLTVSRDRFDRLFSDQMAGGQAARQPRPADVAAGDSAKASTEKSGAENVVADLNRRFGLTWSAETTGRRVDGDRVFVDINLTMNLRMGTHDER